MAIEITTTVAKVLMSFQGNESAYSPLSDAQLRKLRQLSVASLAAHSRSLPYADLMDELGLSSRRELEDLVIEAIYAEVVKGKLDQRNACFQVDQALARDVTGMLLLFSSIRMHTHCREYIRTTGAKLTFISRYKHWNWNYPVLH